MFYTRKRLPKLTACTRFKIGILGMYAKVMYAAAGKFENLRQVLSQIN